jgi:hypothetical protein
VPESTAESVAAAGPKSPPPPAPRRETPSRSPFNSVLGEQLKGVTPNLFGASPVESEND